MAESNATQVILTDDGIKIIKAQNTADNAAGGVASLNDPNLMSVIEKQYNVSQFAGLTSQYNVLIQNAKDDGIDTTAVTAAYNNLNQFMDSVLADPDHASDVDRVTYKKYQDAYNEELANLQNALQNNANNKFTSAANATSQAASTASQAKSTAESAFSQAQVISNKVDSEMAVQSTATDKAQSAADSAFNQAKTAIDNGNATSQAVTDLKDGSTMTIAELQNGLAKKVAKSEYASYTEQTASQIGEMVTNGAFSAYKQTTAGLISDKVATSEFSSYKEETAKAIGNMVESKDFKSYRDQTDKALEDKVSSADYKSDKKQTANMISDTVSDAINGLKISNRNLALGTATAFKTTGNGSGNYTTQMYSLSSTIAKGTTVTITFDITSTNATGVYTVQFIGGTWQTVTGVDYLNGLPLVSGTQHLSYTLVTDADFTNGVQLRLDNSTSTVTISNFIISESSKEVNWTPAPEDQATQSQFTLLKNSIDFRVTKKGLVDEINLQAGNTLISSSGQLTLSGKTIYFDSANPVMIPSANISTLLVGKNLKAADISANTFMTNNGTFTVDENGAVTATRLSIIGNKNFVYNSELLGNAAGWELTNGGHVVNNSAHAGTLGLNWNSTTNGANWVQSARSKLMPVNYSNDRAFSASAWLLVRQATKGTVFNLALRFWDSSLKQVGAEGTNYTSDGNYHDWSLVTVENLVMPSTASYVSIDYNAYNGSGDFTFSQPMINQGSKYQGYTSDTGNVVSAGEIDGSVINGSTINGGTLNMQNDGLINSPYTGIQQTTDQFYHPWKLNTGQLTIGQGYITSVSSGTRSINGVPKQFDSLQGTLSASYLKFTNNYGARTYIDADMLTCSSPTNGGAMVAINATGNIGISAGTMSAPALTISNGYIDASSSSSYGTFGAITLGYHAHTINSDDSLFFESGHGSGNPGINIWAKGFQSLSSRLSTKRQVRLLDDEHSNSLLLGADTATFQYNQDTNADNSNEGVIIDDVNTAKQYGLPNELMTRDGKAPTDLMSFIARVISQNKYQARLIEDLQIRLRKVEIKNE